MGWVAHFLISKVRWETGDGKYAKGRSLYCSPGYPARDIRLVPSARSGPGAGVPAGSDLALIYGLFSLLLPG